MRTRATATAVLCTAAVWFAGCSSSTVPGTSGSPEGGASEITVWTWTGAPGADTMDAIGAAFEKETGIKVNSVVVERDDYLQQLQLALNAGDSTLDVIGVQPNDAAKQAQPHLLPLSDWKQYISVDESAFTPLSIEQSHKLFTDDQLYSLPFGSTGATLCFYNADMLGELGVTAPQTWSDMKVFSDKLKSAKPDVMPLVFPGDGWGADQFVLTMVGQTDPEFYNNFRYNNAPLNTPSFVAGLTKFKELYDNGTLSRDGLDLSYADAMAAFYQGKSAIACNGTWEAGMLRKSFREANKIDISSIGVMAIPADDPATHSIRAFLDITLGIPKYSIHPAEAAKFIEFATAGKGADILGSYLGFVPAVNGWSLDPSVLGDDPEAAKGYALIQQLVANPHSDRNNLVAFSQHAGQLMTEVVNGRLTPQAAADQMQTDWDSGKFS